MALRLGTTIGLALALLALGTGCGGGQESSESSTSTAPRQSGGEQSIERFGAEAQGAQRQAILASFDGYLDSLAQRDYASLCADLAAQVRASLARLGGGAPQRSCPEVVPALLAPSAASLARSQANDKVVKVRVEGTQAFVVFRAPGAELYQMPLADEGGEWKVGILLAAVLVPEV